MKVDFHVHSTFSDGTLPPEELARSASGFAAVALTDHDSTSGVERFRAAARSFKPVAGVELSVEPGEGFDKFHLLGLGMDGGHPQMRALFEKIVDGRNARNEEIFANFRALGIEIPPEDLHRYSDGGVLARPHFARWLMERGFAPSIKAAFEKYLLASSPSATNCYAPRWHPGWDEAFGAIHAAGGLCVMAHPRYWRRSWAAEGVDCRAAESGFARLKEAGLDGVEAVYQANSPEEDVAFTLIADRLGLLKTAGSDFHGANKPGIVLGMEVSGKYISPFLEALDLI